MFASKDALFSGAAVANYAVNNSLRFRSSATAYLNRTFGTATSQSIFTVSVWVKRGKLGALQTLFGCTTTQFDGISFSSADQIIIYSSGTASITTAAVYRDPSSWYHIVYSHSGTSNTVYVNNVNVGTGTFSESIFNTVNSHIIGQNSSTNFFDGYLAEFNFIDGQALTPSSFGAYNATTGVWQPALYTGSYGTNGFYLNFSSFGTAAALGNDSSGNGNTWTVNNISVTAGTTYDPMLDVPTLTSATVANFAVLNPLNAGTNASSSSANLAYSCGTNSTITTSVGITSGKWYWEIQAPTTSCLIGLVNGSVTLNTYIGVNVNGWGYYGTTGAKYNNGASAYGLSFTSTDTIGVAFDATNGTLIFYKNNSSQGTAFTGLTSGPYFPAVSDDTLGGATGTFNFGQRSFVYTPPTGYVALNTYNISAGTVITSGSFTGTALANGPFIWLNGTPTAMTINGNAVTFGTHADKLANGFKVRTSSTSYNSTGSNTYSVSTTGAQFKYQIAQGNP